MLGGGFASLLGSYFMFSRDMSKEVSFIKGQLVMVIQHLSHLPKIAESHAVLDKDHARTRAELNAAFEKIRSMEKRQANGGLPHD
jgi:hypothetical protein